MEEPPIILDLEASMQHQLNTLCSNANEAENFTIFRTPHNISESKKNLFEPFVISIGPFHRGQKHLRALEEQKWRFLRNFLSRGEHISLNLCISKMKSLEERTRRCYSETFYKLKSDAFVEMMLLDGCFVLEYFLNIFAKNLNSIREVGWNSSFIQCDLLLIENQIPFFIVEELYQIRFGLNPEHKKGFIRKLAKLFLDLGQSKDIITDLPAEMLHSILPDPPTEIHHLVHLCYHYLVPNPEKPVVSSSKSFDLTTKVQTSCIELSLSVASPNSTKKISSILIPSATELKQKGLKFEPKSNPKNMLDISFERGVLKIPTLAITDDTKPIFANLIAFEHSKYRKDHSPFTTFVFFVDNLVNTQNDVIILKECGIVENWLGSEEALTHFFNQITDGGRIDEEHYLAELNTELNIYIESSWHKHRAKLIRDYFSNPWAAISLVAAIILLVLTLVQSFFAIYAYYIPPSS